MKKLKKALPGPDEHPKHTMQGLTHQPRQLPEGLEIPEMVMEVAGYALTGGPESLQP